MAKRRKTQEVALGSTKEVAAETKVESVKDRLSGLGALFDDRQAVYGDNFLYAGGILKNLFPRGLTLQTEEEWNDLFLFVHVISKVSRYAQAMERGIKHGDSLDDMSVYSMMMSFANEYFERKKKE